MSFARALERFQHSPFRRDPARTDAALLGYGARAFPRVALGTNPLGPAVPVNEKLMPSLMRTTSVPAAVWNSVAVT